MQHFFVATGVGTTMILGGIACFLHGFFPFAFKTTGSRTIRALYERLSHGARQKTMQSLDAQNAPEASKYVSSARVSAQEAMLEYSI